MKPLLRTKFGNPILRKKAKRVSLDEMKSPAFKRLVKEMFLNIENSGVGLAAPQIGKSIQLAVINVHPLPHRPYVDSFKRVIVNPKILEYSREEDPSYEGCLSFDGLRAEAYRAKRIKVSYMDEHGKKYVEWVDGFLATVFQHEVDHLNGVLFVDHVKDSRTIITAEEYVKRVR